MIGQQQQKVTTKQQKHSTKLPSDTPSSKVLTPHSRAEYIQELRQIWENASLTKLPKAGKLMQLMPQITFRGMSSSAAIDTNLRSRIDKLNEFYDHIMNCRVMVETSHRHHQGNLYHIRIDLTVPGSELVANRDPPEHQENEDIHVAIRDAFDAAERELKDYAQCQRGDVKTHKVSPHGRIATLFPDEGYGFIEASDGREIYFHQNSLLNIDFGQLEVGQEVRFSEEIGEQGSQASTVQLVGKHHLQDLI